MLLLNCNIVSGQILSAKCLDCYERLLRSNLSSDIVKMFDKSHEINWQQTRITQSEHLTKTKFDHVRYSTDYSTKKTTRFINF